jgi:hypothetical protein
LASDIAVLSYFVAGTGEQFLCAIFGMKALLGAVIESIVVLSNALGCRWWVRHKHALTIVFLLALGLVHFPDCSNRTIKRG